MLGVGAVSYEENNNDLIKKLLLLNSSCNFFLSKFLQNAGNCMSEALEFSRVLSIPPSAPPPPKKKYKKIRSLATPLKSNLQIFFVIVNVL